jgi:hypothetical protein
VRYLLTVTVPDRRVFDSYWYGVGTVLDVVETISMRKPGTLTYTVDYGADRYRAQYQCDRFASGLYFGRVDEVTS